MEGPANCMAFPEPKNKPVPMVPPIAISCTCRFFKSLFNSCLANSYAPVFIVLVVNVYLHGLGERDVIIVQLAFPICCFSPITKWTIKKEIG